MLAERNVGKPVQTMTDSFEIAGPHMIIQVRVLVADFRRLLGGEVASLPLRDRQEPPMSGLCRAVSHVQNPSNYLKYYARSKKRQPRLSDQSEPAESDPPIPYNRPNQQGFSQRR